MNMMVSKKEEKYFNHVCIKARSVEISLLAAVYTEVFYSEIKRLKDVQPINLCINQYKTI